MENEQLTPEKVAQHIEAAFHSVDLINKTITEEKNEENKNTVKRNFEHLEIMLEKEFFSTGLTEQQKTDIDASVAAGKAFIA